MKKNLVMRIAAVVLMCTLVTACFASSTFAKYTSQADSAANVARVAKWSILTGEDGKLDITGSEAQLDVDVFDYTDSNVQSKNSDTVIAPGTKGGFGFDDIKNDSEVTAKIQIKLVEIKNPANIPVTFTDGTNTFTTITEEKVIAEKVLKAGETWKAADITSIAWEWIFDGDDAYDTALGIKGNDTVTVTVAIAADQVD